jgi:hypothetical protein
MQTRADPTTLTATLFASGGLAALLLSLVICWSPSPIALSVADFIFGILYFSLIAALVTVPIALVAGLPGYFLLMRLDAFNAPNVCFIGIGCGLLVHLTTDFLELSWLTCAATGFASAFLAWLLLSHSNHSSRRTRGTPRTA